MSASMQFVVTFFPSQQAFSKSEQTLTIHALAERIRRSHAPTKAELPWLKLGFFGDQRTANHCLRSNANLRWVSGIEADYDLEKIGLGDAVDALEEACVAAIVYTSASHSELKPRWRVLCPFSLGRPCDQRNRFLARLNGLFGGAFSNESWTLSQAFYYGSVGNTPSHQVAEIYGHCIDQMDELDDGAISKSAQGPSLRSEASADTIADAELIAKVVTTEMLHSGLCALAARFIGRRIGPDTVAEMLRGFMLATPLACRDARWHHRYEQIPSLVQSAQIKFAHRKPEAWRAVARITHRMAVSRQPSEDIVREVTAAAEHHGLDVERALRFAGRICAEVVGETRYA